MLLSRKIFFSLLLFFIFALSKGLYGIKTVTMATTTSVEDSGLISKIIPLIEKKLNFRLRVIAVGSGQALRIAQDDNCDLVISHAPELEIDLLKKKPYIQRFPLMFNYFMLVGPKNDPANLKDLPIDRALQKIAKQNILFISRGDYSGTYEKEQEIWKKLNIKPSFENYLSSGSGMQITLRIANQKKAYTLTDSSSFFVLEKNLPNLKIISEPKNDDFKNSYSLLIVQKKNKSQNRLLNEIVRFFKSEEFKSLLQEIKINGKQIFFSESTMN